MTIFATGTSVGFEDVAVTIRLAGLVSGSATTKLTLATPSSLIVWLAMAEIVGASFRGFTVTVKVRVTRLFEALPSFTVTVTKAVPLAFARGDSRRLAVAAGLV